MPPVASSDFGISSLAADQHHAESLLAELAIELRLIPIDEPTLALHLRALSLKRAVMRWTEEQPEEAIRRALLDEVLGMQGEARDWRAMSSAMARR